jgi:hypothetical protein
MRGWLQAAHPRELADSPEFEEAVRLLGDPDIDLDRVLQYVRGTNWAIACAALAALAKRRDGEEAVDDILAQFHRLVGWAMYFARAYLTEIDPRPAVGAPVVSAQHWWTNFPIVPLVFRDFARRAALGDRAEFGRWLHSQAASPPGFIKAFLESVDHPFATALISQSDAGNKPNVDHAS